MIRRILACFLAFAFATSVVAKKPIAPEDSSTPVNIEYKIPDYVWTHSEGDQYPTPPRAIKRIDAKYPKELKKVKMDGEAVVCFIVEPDGSISNIVAIEATNKYFAEAAEEAIKKWKIKPALLDGKPVAMLMKTSCKFKR